MPPALTTNLSMRRLGERAEFHQCRLAETHGKAGIDFSLDEITHENFSGWLQGSSRFILAFGQSLAPDRYDFARGGFLSVE